MEEQLTISRPVSYSGIGLRSGQEVTLTLRPSEPDTGVSFRRVDLPGKPDIPARLEWVTETNGATSVGREGAEVMVVEHVLSAVYGLGIDNLRVELNSSEPPVGDGSSLPFCQVLEGAGVEPQGKPKCYAVISRPTEFEQGGASLFCRPSHSLKISFLVQYDHPLLSSQYGSFIIDRETYREELAPARTFTFLRLARELKRKGLAKGGSLQNTIVIGEETILNPTPLRFQDEFVRHKIVDLLGDLALLGSPLKGHIVAFKSGHAKNISFLKRLVTGGCIERVL